MRLTLTKRQVGQPADVGRHTSDAQASILEQTPGRVMFVYVMWFFVWYDPDWMVEALGAGTILVKLYALMFLPVCILLITHFRRVALFWPFLVIIGVFTVWVPFALNRGYLLNGFGKFLEYSLLTALTVSVLETPKQVVLLLKLFLFHFIWFGVQGLPTAGVPWHQNLSNDDSYGPFMTIGLGFSYYVAMGTTAKKYRYLAFLLCFLGVVGTIMSFARGAFIALCVLFAMLAARTPRKQAFLAYGTVLIVAGLIVIMVMFPNGEFWNEMATITEEGASAGTGEQRWVMWQAAWQLFLAHPILGVGPGNFGPNAVEYFTERGVTDMGNTFTSPEKMYSMALHNDYMQVLVEQGLVGLFAFAAVFINFFVCLRFLRTEAVQKAWASSAGGFIDSSNLALGLEAAMIACMANSVFYNQYYVPWLWSLVMLAYVSAAVSKKMLAGEAFGESRRFWRNAASRIKLARRG